MLWYLYLYFCILEKHRLSQKTTLLISPSIHFGLVQIKKIAEGSRLGNKAEFVLGAHMSPNQQNQFIG